MRNKKSVTCPCCGADVFIGGRVPFRSRSAALARKQAIDEELAALANSEVHRIQDRGPNAHALAVARILRTPRGRQLAAESAYALLDSKKAKLP